MDRNAYPAVIALVGIVLSSGGCGGSKPDDGIGPIRVVDAAARDGIPRTSPASSITVDLLRPADGGTLEPEEPFECVATVAVPEGEAIPTFVIAEFKERTGRGAEILAGNGRLSPAEDGPGKQDVGGETRIEYRAKLNAPNRPGRYIFSVEAIIVTYVVNAPGAKPENSTTRIRSEEIGLEVSR